MRAVCRARRKARLHANLANSSAHKVFHVVMPDEMTATARVGIGIALERVRRWVIDTTTAPARELDVCSVESDPCGCVRFDSGKTKEKAP